MPINVGTLDRVLRAALGVGLLYLAFLSGLPAFAAPVLKYGAAAVGVVLLLTAATRFCPLYTLFGVKTCRS
ncbi:DUF2892 domain-containing protein [Rhodobacterales bacterium HKCCE3408]|nr:DUF2892 domain-containing protein [Rhodobacterales bacterium HKCCE3408]